MLSAVPRLRRSIVAICALLAAGCSAASSGSGDGFTGDSSGKGAGAGDATSATSTTAAGFGGFAPGAGGAEPVTSTGAGAGGGGAQEVFAHGPSVLYKLDPVTNAVTEIGHFQGCDQIIDIAIDKDGVMFGTTSSNLFTIDKTTARCTHVANGSYPNSLSLVPQGTLDPNEEALVGYVGGDYIRIDKTTGAISQIGTIGHGYSSSGDIVSVIGGGTYLTVNGSGCGDCIVQVDPATGALVSMIGSLNHAQVFGLAFWGGAAYGFDNGGQLFSIDLTNAQTTLIPTGGLDVPQFWGAGSSTSAPLVMPH
ncbi:MAG TPA: hypothetical protein VGM56_32510 [Byssovorax sp.]|jgi:hypothetical protein